MSDNKNRSFLSEYETFRSLLRTIFFFGSFTIDDFLLLEDLNIKKTQYQNYKIIAEDIIERLSSHKEHSKTALKYDVEQFADNYNELVESFFIKTLTSLEAGMTIAILLRLSSSEWCTDKELYDFFDDQNEKTVKIKVQAMIENGLIIAEGFKYRIADNPLRDLSKKDFQRLLCFVDFQKSRIYPNCFGAFLFSVMRRLYERRYSCIYESPFVMKCNHLGNILDDEIQWDLIQAILLRKTVSFQYKNTINTNREIRDMIPIKLVTEGQQNRVYLFGIRRTSRGDKKRFYRLDKISRLEITGCMPDQYAEDYMQEVYRTALQYSFSHIPISEQNTTVLELSFDPCMRTELERQFSCITFDDERHIAAITVQAKDNVLNPWLRAYADKVKILNDCPIKDKFEEEMREMKKLYGIVS